MSLEMNSINSQACDSRKREDVACLRLRELDYHEIIAILPASRPINGKELCRLAV